MGQKTQDSLQHCPGGTETDEKINTAEAAKCEFNKDYITNEQ